MDKDTTRERDDKAPAAATAKRQKMSHPGTVTTTEALDKPVYYHPTSFVTWNCNGFTSRCLYNRELLHQLVQHTASPDVICLQEARLRAAGPGPQRGRPQLDNKKDASQPIRDALRDCFGAYTPVWSLADTKYAGTLTLLHQRCLQSSGSSPLQNPEGRYDPDLVAFTPHSAIELMLRRLGTTREECGLVCKKKTDNHTGVPSSLSSLTSPKKKPKQTSLTSFFAPKPKPNTNTTTAATTDAGSSRRQHLHEHDEEGRFQFFFFPGMDVVQTYVPNNRFHEKAFERRKQWDESMLQFVKERTQILQTLQRKRKRKQPPPTAGNNHATPNHGNGNHARAGKGIRVDTSLDRKFLWCGDMNVAATYRDGSHWKFSDDKEDQVYEWFRDKANYQDKSNTKEESPQLPQHVGIPGFTPAERERFAVFCKEGGFCDVWRELHPNGVVVASDQDQGESYNNSNNSSSSNNNNSSVWERPNYTWRGSLARNFKGSAKFEGKGQRIDYFLLSSQLGLKEVETCEIRGYGTKREGLFCGSDHCAVELRLKPNHRCGNQPTHGSEPLHT